MRGLSSAFIGLSGENMWSLHDGSWMAVQRGNTITNNTRFVVCAFPSEIEKRSADDGIHPPYLFFLLLLLLQLLVLLFKSVSTFESLLLFPVLFLSITCTHVLRLRFALEIYLIYLTPTIFHRTVSSGATGAAGVSGAGLLGLVQDGVGVTVGGAGRFWDNFKHQARNFVTDEPPEEVEVMELSQDAGLMSDLQEMSAITYQQRFIGFFATLGMGLCFITISFFFLPSIALFPKKFAFFLTLGNLFSLASTTFLVGFQRQFRLMFDARRLEAAVVYAVSLIMTLIAALHWKSGILAIIFAAVQVCSMLWYTLSYVPFARRVFEFAWSYLWAMLYPLLSTLGHVLQHCCGALFSLAR